MLDVYTLLNNIIEPICPCFTGHYPTTETKVYPFVEVKFPNITPGNSYSDINLLQVDIWDNKDTNIIEIETKTDLIHKALNKLRYNDSKMQLTINRDFPYRLELLDPEINIQRRQLRYTVKIYYK